MTTQRRRGGYNESASHVGDAETPPQINPYACAAHGCPLAGSITVAGRRVCFVHLAIREQSGWDAATTVLRRRLSYVAAIAVLRSPGTLTADQALEHARHLIPALSPKHRTAYDALLAIESRLTALAKQAAAGALDPDDGSAIEPGGPTAVVAQIRELTARFAARTRVSEVES